MDKRTRRFPLAGFLLPIFVLGVLSAPLRAQDDARLPHFAESPDGAVVVRFGLGREGGPLSAVELGGRTVLEASPLGLVTSVAGWTTGLRVVSESSPEATSDRYTLLHGKCSTCAYVANHRVVRLSNADGAVLDVVFQVSNDGVALRYRIPAMPGVDTVTATRELTGFRLPESAHTWLMPMDDPSSGWMHVNPAYESHYVMDGHVGAKAPTGVGWAFPGLFQVGDVGWALVTEAGVDGTYCASRLKAFPGTGFYGIGFPEPGEGTGPDDPVDPSFTLPFASPWRLIVVGRTLAPIVDSHLVTDVSAPSRIANPDFVKPGKAAWSWLPLKDRSIVPDTQRRFIDMAAEQGYPYVLVDNWWDRQIGYEGLAELVKYAAAKGVGILVWYNSNGHFNDAPQTPKNRMIDPEVRRAEFRRLSRMGVRGVKVDFMGGDKQSVIRLYLDILRDAAAARLMVNFHGATLPRGWSRTWPNYMTAEAVRGYEYITFGQEDADLAPSHAAVLPFTRNAVGPMDFTPTMFSDTVGASVRTTSDAFDLHEHRLRVGAAASRRNGAEPSSRAAGRTHIPEPGPGRLGRDALPGRLSRRVRGDRASQGRPLVDRRDQRWRGAAHRDPRPRVPARDSWRHALHRRRRQPQLRSEIDGERDACRHPPHAGPRRICGGADRRLSPRPTGRLNQSARAAFAPRTSTGARLEHQRGAAAMPGTD